MNAQAFGTLRLEGHRMLINSQECQTWWPARDAVLIFGSYGDSEEALVAW